MSNYFEKIASRTEDTTGNSLSEQNVLPRAVSFERDQVTGKQQSEPEIMTHEKGVLSENEPVKKVQNVFVSIPEVKKSQHEFHNIVPVKERVRESGAAIAGPKYINNSSDTTERQGESNSHPSHKIVQTILLRNEHLSETPKERTSTDELTASNAIKNDFAQIAMPVKQKPIELKDERNLTGRSNLPPQISKDTDTKMETPAILPPEIKTPTAPGKKSSQENKVVIGRISVEVVNKVQASVKTPEEKKRNGETRNESNHHFTSINKLSFGLGQM